jgi:hypothetical protein
LLLCATLPGRLIQQTKLNQSGSPCESNIGAPQSHKNLSDGCLVQKLSADTPAVEGGILVFLASYFALAGGSEPSRHGLGPSHGSHLIHTLPFLCRTVRFHVDVLQGPMLSELPNDGRSLLNCIMSAAPIHSFLDSCSLMLTHFRLPSTTHFSHSITNQQTVGSAPGVE